MIKILGLTLTFTQRAFHSSPSARVDDDEFGRTEGRTDEDEDETCGAASSLRDF